MTTDSNAGSEPSEEGTGIFHDEEFERNYPDLMLPPPSFRSSGARVVLSEKGRSLTLDFPVREDQANPIGTLQGGILCSFFDDAFGTLSFVSLRKPCVTIDMNVNFMRGARPGETVRIRAEFRSKTRRVLQLQAEAYNDKGKLLATASSNLLVMGS